MKLGMVDLNKLKTDILRIIGKYLDLSNCQIFFFGSRVTGGGNERSDIDIGLESSEPISLEIMAQIREEIDNLPILYKIDIVDFSAVSEQFRLVAKQKIEVFN